MVKNFIEKKYNQKDIKMPIYILLFLSCYVIWQMGIIWLDSNNSIIQKALLTNNNFISNLSVVCVIVSVVTMIILIIKPFLAYKICKISSIISLITTIFYLFTKQYELCLYVLVSTCSVLSFATLAIYIFTYNSNNLKKQITIEMLGVGIISLLTHTNIIKLSPTIIYSISLILLTLFIIGIFKITELDITFVKIIKKSNNKSLYIEIIVLSIIFNMISIFGGNIVIHINNGLLYFFIGHIIGALLFFLLHKSKINKTYIPNIYISIFIIAIATILLYDINIYSAFLLGMSNALFYAITYYCNLVYKNTLTKSIYIVYNIIGIVTIILMDYLLNLSDNNLSLLLKIYVIISIITISIMFILSNDLNKKIEKMLKKELKESLFIPLSQSERNIADLLLKNYTNGEIASSVYLSQNTVKFHIKNIYRKLNINSRKEFINLFND